MSDPPGRAIAAVLQRIRTRPRLPRHPMDEAWLLDRVTYLASALGLLFHHCRDSRRCQGPRGFPDIVLAGAHGLILAELKGPDGEPSPDQALWHWTLDQGRRAGPCQYRLWYPRDWHSGKIQAELQAIA